MRHFLEVVDPRTLLVEDAELARRVRPSATKRALKARRRCAALPRSCSAKDLLDRFKRGEKLSATNEELWSVERTLVVAKTIQIALRSRRNARRIRDACIHPVTGEKVRSLEPF